MNVPSLTETNLPKVIQAILDLARGGTNALPLAPIELTSGQTETSVVDRLCGAQSLPVLVPVSEGASSVRWWIKSVAPGAFLVGHEIVPPGCLFRYELRRN